MNDPFLLVSYVDLSRALSREPGNAELAMKFARTCRHLDRDAEAIPVLERAIEFAPDPFLRVRLRQVLGDAFQAVLRGAA